MVISYSDDRLDVLIDMILEAIFIKAILPKRFPDHVSQPIRLNVDRQLIFTFYHDAGEIFCARISKQKPSDAVEFLFDLTRGIGLSP